LRGFERTTAPARLRTPTSGGTRRKAALILLLAIGIVGCSATEANNGSTSPGTESDEAPASATTAAIPTESRFIATITDEWGRPIPGADVEGSRSSIDGIAVGAASADGWYAVTAAGYASVVVERPVTAGGHAVFEVALQPIGSIAFLDDGDSATVSIGGDSTEGASLDLPAGAFTDPVFVEVSELRRPPASMLHAPGNDAEAPYPNRVFTLAAFGMDRSERALEAAGQLLVFDDGYLSDDAPFARFDRETGAWVVEGRCSRNVDHLACPVTSFSHHAVLGPAPRSSDPAPPGADQEYQDSRAAVEDAAAAGSDIPLDELRHMIEAAEVAAERDPSEVAKQRLVGAQIHADAYLAGEYDLRPLISSIYNQLAASLAAEVAAAEDPCPLWPRLVVMLEEAMILNQALGLEPSGAKTIRDLIGQVELECALFWEGEIVFTFPTPRGWEIYNSIPPTDFVRFGDTTWSEKITVYINAPNGVVTGTAHSSPFFDIPIVYIWDAVDTCGDDWQELELRSRTEGAEPWLYLETWRFSDNPDDPDDPFETVPTPVYPAPEGVVMEFSGTYDEPTFEISGPRRVDANAPLMVETLIRTSQWILAPCEHTWLETVLEDSVWEFQSMLLDGFGPLNPHEPHLTLHDILNADRQVLNDGTVVIKGQQRLEFTLDLVVPFAEAIVTWDIRTKRADWAG
jgi:hypothetical protein